MVHASFFAGEGGFDLAAEWAGWQNLFHVEKNPFCRRILNHYWPNAISYEDIKETDFTRHRGAVDVVSGGFPCQPYSTAGKRLGKDDERHLWPEMLRGIREIQPPWVVGENVRGLVSWNGGLVFEEVCADLETEGYEVTPFILPAAGVGAPHIRYRVFFIAYSADAGAKSLQQPGKNRVPEPQFTANPNGNGYGSNDRYRQARQAKETIERPEQRKEREQEVGEWHGLQLGRIFAKRNAADTDSIGFQVGHGEQDWRQSQSIIKRQGGIIGWENFPTQSPVCGGNDGLPSQLDGITFSKWRKESLKAHGNAVCPYLAYQIFKVIDQMHHS